MSVKLMQLLYHLADTIILQLTNYEHQHQIAILIMF